MKEKRRCQYFSRWHRTQLHIVGPTVMYDRIKYYFRKIEKTAPIHLTKIIIYRSYNSADRWLHS